MPSPEEQRPPASPISPVREEATPPTPTSPPLPTNKRKRSHSPKHPSDLKQSHPQPQTQESINDIWTVLESHDISPSILDHLPVSLDSQRKSDEPATKKAKFSAQAPATTLKAKVAQGSYTSLEQFESDITAAATHLTSTLQTSLDTFNATAPWRLILDELGPDTLIDRLHLLANLGADLVSREVGRLARCTTLNQHRQPRIKTGRSVDHIKHETDTEKTDQDRDSRSVLTLFGNAQGHKQLFSSLQLPSADRHGGHKVRELGLPHGINSTKLYLQDGVGKKRSSTLQDLFAPPSALPQVSPPKVIKSTLNRDATLTWSRSSVTDQSSTRSGYVNEKASTGRWLGYAGVAAIEEPSSPQTKRRQRDRALSMNTSDATQNAAPATTAAQRQAKEEALFRSAFSSFAPNHDNSAALVPEETRSDIWWQRFGIGFFDDAFDAHEDELAQVAQQDHDMKEADLNEEDSFRKAVEDYDPAFNEQEQESERLLKEVSEMIETLHSFQRLRMSSLPTAARPGLSYAASQGSGSPSTPSLAEVETYKTLKAQLALIVSTLPPYIVSKLDGEQLNDLKIVRQLYVEAPNHRGVMEEDQASRVAKQQAFQAAVGVARGQGQSGASTPAQHGQGRGSQVPQTARPATQQNNRGGPGMNAAVYGRQHLSNWQNPTQNAPQRPPYASPQAFSQPRPGMNGSMQRPAYSQSAPRPQGPQVNGSYQGSSQLNYQQRPSNYGSPYTGQSNSPSKVGQTGQTSQTSHTGQTGQSAYQPRGSVPQQQQNHLAQPQADQRSQSQLQSLTQGFSSASPQLRQSVGPPNGVSRPQTPATPLMGQVPQALPTASQAPTPKPLTNGTGSIGTPQPQPTVSQQASQKQIAPQETEVA